jgi:hypothetical protein
MAHPADRGEEGQVVRTLIEITTVVALAFLVGFVFTTYVLNIKKAR